MGTGCVCGEMDDIQDFMQAPYRFMQVVKVIVTHLKTNGGSVCRLGVSYIYNSVGMIVNVSNFKGNMCVSCILVLYPNKYTDYICPDNLILVNLQLYLSTFICLWYFLLQRIFSWLFYWCINVCAWSLSTQSTRRIYWFQASNYQQQISSCNSLCYEYIDITR